MPAISANASVAAKQTLEQQRLGHAFAISGPRALATVTQIAKRTVAFQDLHAEFLRSDWG
jgi:hypothetical protein